MHGLKVGDKIYGLSISGYTEYAFLHDPLGADEYVVIKITPKQVVAKQSERTYTNTFRAKDFGRTWHLTLEGALRYARSLEEGKLARIHEHLKEIDEYLAIAAKRQRVEQKSV